MAYWTNKHWGAVIGVALVVAIVLIGPGFTALGVLFGLGGFFAGKVLDGELDLEEIRARAQSRFGRGEQANAGVSAPGAGVRADIDGTGVDPGAGQPVGARPPGSGRVR